VFEDLRRNGRIRFQDFVCLNIQMPFSPEAIQHKLGLHVVAEPARKADF